MAGGMLGVGEIVLRLGIAALFGAMVGVERERRVRSAGIRTMSLVGLGSALFTVAAMYPFDSVARAAHGTRTIRIWASAGAAAEVMARAQEICLGAGLDIEALTLAQSKRGGDVIGLAARMRDVRQVSEAVVAIRQLPGVSAVHGDLRGTGIGVSRG